MNHLSDFKPLHDQILVQPLREVERFSKLRSGLYLPDNPERDRKREFCWEGKVILCGPGDRRKDGSFIPLNVQPGDRVLYDRRPWAEIQLDGTDYVVLHEEQHIVAVIE